MLCLNQVPSYCHFSMLASKWKRGFVASLKYGHIPYLQHSAVCPSHIYLLSSYIWLVATVLDSIDEEERHNRTFRTAHSSKAMCQKKQNIEENSRVSERLRRDKYYMHVLPVINPGSALGTTGPPSIARCTSPECPKYCRVGAGNAQHHRIWAAPHHWALIQPLDQV